MILVQSSNLSFVVANEKIQRVIAEVNRYLNPSHNAVAPGSFAAYLNAFKIKIYEDFETGRERSLALTKLEEYEMWLQRADKKR
jgi:hypothetical protein